MNQQSTMSQCPSYRQPWKSFISKTWKKLLVIPVLFMTLLAFSAFSAPQAQAAPVSGKVLSSPNVANCGVVKTNENDSSSYILTLWENTCTGGHWASITANTSGTFELYFYGNGYLLSHNYGYLYPGQYISSPEFSGYSSYSDYGVYDG